MDFQQTFKHETRIEVEKRIFGDAIHVNRTYGNKKRKINNTFNIKDPCIEELPGNCYPPILAMDQQKRSTLKVEQWLESVDEQRKPFEDLNPNIANATRSKKIFAKSLNNNVDVENAFSSVKCDVSKRKNASGVTKQPPRKRKSNGVLAFKTQKLESSVDNNVEDVFSLHESVSHHSDSVVFIEDEPKAQVDKDFQAWQQVLKAESNIKKEPHNNTIVNCLQRNIDMLRVDISLLEPQALKEPLYLSKSLMLWSQNTLSHTLNYEPEKIKAQLIQNKKLQTAESKMNKSIQLPKKKCRKFRKKKNKAKVSKPSPTTERGKNKCTVAMQDNKPIPFYNTVVVETETKETINSHAFREQLEDCKPNQYLNEICEINSEIPDNEMSILKVIKHRSESETSVSTGSAHDMSGSHRVSVQFHASMDCFDNDSGERFNTPSNVSQANQGSSLQNTPRKSSNANISPSFWDQQYQTPTRGSPTYTLTPPSNSSSNKENYAPITPQKETKELKKKKESTKSSTCRPLSLLFEAPRAKVCVICSNLQISQVLMVKYLCKKMGWAFSEEFNPDVTHLVIGTNDDNRVERTVKYICGVAAGCWVVSCNWVEQCIRQDVHLTEDNFEVLDWSGEPGPLLARTSADKLFAGFTFCCLPSVSSIRSDILCWIIEAAGGRTVKVTQLTGSALVGPIVVLHEFQDDNSQLFEEAANWKVMTAILNYEWLVECVGRYRLLPPDLFFLCPIDHVSASVDNQNFTTARNQNTTANNHEWLYALCQTENNECDE